MSQLTIVIPAYNEEAALRELIPQLLRFCEEHDFTAIVVNDGSSDGSARLLEEYTSHLRLEVVHNKVNLGYGGAIKAGIRRCRTPWVITVDGDGQHVLDDVVKLYQRMAATGADLVVGRRRGIEQHWYRAIGKLLLRSVARMLMPVPVKDLNSGMKLYNTRLAQRYLRLCPDNMAYSDIITLVFLNRCHLVVEEDIQVRKRASGASTINTRTAFDTLFELVNVVILFNPMRIFLPVAAGFLVGGIAWGLPILLRGDGVSIGTLLMLISGLLFFLLGLLAEQLSLIRRDQVDAEDRANSAD